MLGLVLFILLAPLAAFTIVIFLGKRLPRGGDWVSLAAIWGGLAGSIYLFVTQVLGQYNPELFISYQIDWLIWGDFSLKIGIALDNMAIVMLCVVTIVSALVHLYSVGYMKGDPKYSRFFSFLSFFSFSMLGLVLADNLLIIYAFWELVGLSSYLLIGFWHEKDSAADAGKKAFITNRIGDAGMLIGILLVFTTLGTLNIQEIFHKIPGAMEAGVLTAGMLTAIGICLFCGAIGKSAQFPLHVWLPDAMEGPTPVSALIHAATMVAAGVYLVARLFTMLTFDASLVIAYVGGFTALFAATIAVAQNDIKRVLAYSTVSQLGYMVMALGAGAYMAGFFHLVTHAMFKACLFLCSGSVIHAMHGALHSIHSHDDPQDMRYMGGLKPYLPITYWTFLIATIALSGVPFTSGFLSKDAILGGTLAFAMHHPQHFMLPVFGFAAAALTAFYMFRLIYLTFFGKFRSGPEAEKALHESPKSMTMPLVVLATLCFFLFYSLPAFNPTTPSGGWFATLFPDPGRAYDKVAAITETDQHLELHATEQHAGEHHAAGQPGEHAEESGETAVHGDHDSHDVHHKAHNIAMIISILVAGLGILIATMGYYWWKINPATWQRKLGVVYRGMFNKWWSDEIYHATAIKGTLVLSRVLAWFDLYIIDGIVNGAAFVTRTYSIIQGWFDLYIVDGLVNLAAWIVGLWGRIANLFQGGQVQRYILYSVVLIGLFIVLKVL